MFLGEEGEIGFFLGGGEEKEDLMNKKVLGNMKDLEKRIHHFSTQWSLGFLSI